jgi:diguanylate cyclase (GGDEF)-like protein
VFARFGGDEFAMILREISYHNAFDAMRRIGVALATHPVDFGGKPVVITTSAGVACLDCVGESLDSLLERADRALYQAKRAGRNRVVGP